MGLSSASYAMVAMVVSLSVDLIAAQDDGATSPPSELILPSNATSTMAVISTASFDDPCSEDTRTCMALLQ